MFKIYIERNPHYQISYILITIFISGTQYLVRLYFIDNHLDFAMEPTDEKPSPIGGNSSKVCKAIKVFTDVML